MNKIAVTGSFDPITNGHLSVIRRALEVADVAYVVLLINPDRKPLYDTEKRLEMLRLATAKFGERVKVFSYPALAIDFCRENGIQYIARGVRTAADFSYETEMAEWNKKFGGVYTLLFPSENPLSATEVRERLDKGESVSGLVPEEIADKL